MMSKSNKDMKINVLLADDDAGIRLVIGKALSQAGMNVRATDNVVTLLKWVNGNEGNVVLADVHMARDDIFDFLPEIQKSRPELPILIMSANTSVRNALKSGQFKVFEYIPKPFDLDELVSSIRRAATSATGTAGSGRKSQKYYDERIIGKSVAMQPVFRAISDYMSGDIPVHIYGDVGTGKNLTASLIHSSGNRKDRPFLSFDPAQNVLDTEAELMGGDLFVDRIDELVQAHQAVLLRLLDRNEGRRKGDQFRVLSIAYRPLIQLDSENVLRADLLSHLMGGQIFLPPLSERREDIADLADYFLRQTAAPNTKTSFSAVALNCLAAHNWRGNVREVRSVVSRIPLKHADTLIDGKIIKSLLSELEGNTDAESTKTSHNIKDIRDAARVLLLKAKQDGTGDSGVYTEALTWIEKPLIEEALKIARGNNIRAAGLLGIHRNTLRTKIKSLDIQVGDLR